jgi:hypothetical protein
MIARIKDPIKRIRWRGRRAAAARRWGRAALEGAPVVIGNAMPKSGSHLLTQILRGLARIGPFVDPGMPPLTRSATNRNLDDAAVLANIQALQPGDISYSYLHAREPFLSELGKNRFALFFIHRDPRDVIVSHVFFAMNIHRSHGMHAYYTEKLHSMEERISVAIRGVDDNGVFLSPIRVKYDRYLGWIGKPGVHTIRFENLVQDRRQTISTMLDFLNSRTFDSTLSREREIEALESSIRSSASGTFRRGISGEWREHFTGTNMEIFKEETGALLQILGYEPDDSW